MRITLRESTANVRSLTHSMTFGLKLDRHAVPAYERVIVAILAVMYKILLGHSIVAREAREHQRAWCDVLSVSMVHGRNTTEPAITTADNVLCTVRG